jgi:AcrR family transcriptional regulator
VAKAVNAPKRTRREQAAATKERMIRAAIEVFTETGYVGARMSDIANRAGVAVQTVYFTFHTKGELLQACFDFAVLGPERLPPMEQSSLAELPAARSGRAALAAFVHGNTAILLRSAAIKEVAESAPQEPDAAAVVTRSERLRRDGYAQIVRLLNDRFGLRPGLTDGDATDLLLMLSSSATYLSLQRYGWSEEKYVEWLTDTLATQLLAQPRARPGGRRLQERRNPPS